MVTFISAQSGAGFPAAEEESAHVVTLSSKN